MNAAKRSRFRSLPKADSSADQTVEIYAMDGHELLKLAGSRVIRDLTPDECQRYFQSTSCPPLP